MFLPNPRSVSRAAGAFGVLQLAAALGPPVTPVLAIRSGKAAASRSTPKGFADSLHLVGLRRSSASNQPALRRVKFPKLELTVLNCPKAAAWPQHSEGLRPFSSPVNRARKKETQG